MNIVWISNINEKDGFKTSRFEITRALNRRGHQVTLIMAKNFGEHKPKTKDIIYLPTLNAPILSSLSFGIFVTFLVPLLFRNKKIDIFVLDESTILLPFFLILKLFNALILLDIRTLPVDVNKSLRFELNLNLSRYLINGITTISNELKEILHNKYRFDDNKIGIWSSGVSIKMFSDSLFNKGTKNFKSNSGEFILMYHGSYSTTRGIENLIKAIANLNPYLRNEVRLLIVGIQQKATKDLIRLCDEFGVKKQIDFFPQMEYEKICELISSSDVGIIPLPPENLWWRVSAPLKTLEYLAMGKPIIATNIPFHKKIFNMGVCGILLNTNNPKEIANAIMSLYQNKEKLNEMGKKGKEIVERYYSWESKASELEEFLKTILASK